MNKTKKNNKNNFNIKHNSTYKKNKYKICVALMQPDNNIKNNNVRGEVYFIQKKDYMLIKYNIKNLKNGLHGFHIHKCGDLTQGCSSACSHFNPFNNLHGSLKDKNSHAGDLGNIISKNNLAIGTIKTNKVSLNNNKKNIIGRMIIVHEDEDDCGRKNNEESLKTGNAGKRLACGVIGKKNF